MTSFTFVPFMLSTNCNKIYTILAWNVSVFFIQIAIFPRIERNISLPRVKYRTELYVFRLTPKLYGHFLFYYYSTWLVYCIHYWVASFRNNPKNTKWKFHLMRTFGQPCKKWKFYDEYLEYNVVSLYNENNDESNNTILLYAVQLLVKRYHNCLVSWW